MTHTPIFHGFDHRWHDVPEFVLGITRAIWEERNIASLGRYYLPDTIVRSPASVTRGTDAIVAATLASMAEFSDRAHLGEDVIWAPTVGSEADGRAGFFSSHRMTCLATHSGRGMHGPATGAKLRYRIMSDSWCADDKVCDEWVVRDQGAILRQLGRDPRDWTREIIRDEGGRQNCVRPLTPDSDIEGPYGGRGTRNTATDRLEQILTRVMEGDLGAIREGYDRACELAYPGGQDAIGHSAADRFWLGLRSAFPGAGFRVEHRAGREDPGYPPRAAIRWSLYGKHDGPGIFGPPTGAYVYVMGITHAEFGPRGLRREWTLYDETAIWKQILLSGG